MRCSYATSLEQIKVAMQRIASSSLKSAAAEAAVMSIDRRPNVSVFASSVTRAKAKIGGMRVAPAPDRKIQRGDLQS